jgi:hypothetical protein
MPRTDLLRRVQEFAVRHGLVLGETLGYGMHGIVFAAKNQTAGEPLAVKVPTAAEWHTLKVMVFSDNSLSPHARHFVPGVPHNLRPFSMSCRMVRPGPSVTPFRSSLIFWIAERTSWSLSPCAGTSMATAWPCRVIKTLSPRATRWSN